MTDKIKKLLGEEGMIMVEGKGSMTHSGSYIVPKDFHESYEAKLIHYRRNQNKD